MQEDRENVSKGERYTERGSVVTVVIGGFFFFQAEDGIRDLTVTGVQTCALPISAALQHTWSGHAKSQVSEVYKKLLKQREWRLRWAKKTGTGFALPGHQQAAAKARSEERRVGKECRSRWSPYH